MSQSENSRSRTLKEDSKYDTPKSKESLSPSVEVEPPCPCNSIEQEGTLDGFTMSLKGTNSESQSTNERDTENIFHKEVSRYETPKNDDTRTEAICSNTKETELSRMLKDPDDDYRSVSEEISFADCGEPMPTQYLRLDFNPTKRMDKDEFRLKKCADFWKFVDEHPELKTLKVEAEAFDLYENDSFVTLSETSSCSVTTIPPEAMTPITQQAFNWLGNEKIMADSLKKPAGKQPCEPEGKDYLEYCANRTDNWPEIKMHMRQELKPLASSLSLDKAQKSITNLNAKAHPVDDLVKMMAEMHKWDLEHPKSMDPPAHEKLSRKRRIVPYIEKDDDTLCEKCLN